MTAQISDKFFYNEKEHNLVAISERITFRPEEYGITPKMMHTACYRGFYCEYVIKEDILYLEKFTVNSADGNYPEINGKTAIPDPWYVKFCNERKQEFKGPCEYKNLELPIEFSGKMVLGADFLREYYIHMGFQRAWAYKELIELEIEEGIVINVIDHSEKAEALRKGIDIDKSEFDDRLRESGPQFVSDSFSLELVDKTWWI